jgi:CheY-like chemotaxis protein
MRRAQKSSSDHYLPILASWKDTEEHRRSKGHEHILLVDDDPYLGYIMSEMLGSLGYKVISTISGLEALTLFKENPSSFDLVISDMNMPGMNGDELALQLMDIRKDMPIIICSGNSDDFLNELMTRVRIRSYIQKPFEMRVLADTVRKALDEGRSKEYMQKKNLTLILPGRPFGQVPQES